MQNCRQFILGFFACGLALLAHAKDSTATLSIEQPLTLGSGQSLELVAITDERCPRDKRCARAGHVVLLLHWRSGSAAPPMRLTLANSNADGATREACLNGTRIRIRTVTPAPIAGVTVAPTDYHVSVAIGRCENERASS